MVVSVKKILYMINSCGNQSQIDDCRIVIQNYIKAINKNGLANIEDLKKRLDDELLQRQEAIMLVHIFDDKI